MYGRIPISTKEWSRILYRVFLEKVWTTNKNGRHMNENYLQSKQLSQNGAMTFLAVHLMSVRSTTRAAECFTIPTARRKWRVCWPFFLSLVLRCITSRELLRCRRRSVMSRCRPKPRAEQRNKPSNSRLRDGVCSSLYQSQTSQFANGSSMLSSTTRPGPFPWCAQLSRGRQGAPGWCTLTKAATDSRSSPAHRLQYFQHPPLVDNNEGGSERLQQRPIV